MSNRVVQIARNPATGAGVSGATMEVRKVSDNSLVASVTTDAQGRGIFSAGTIGDPGPVKATYVDLAGDTKVHSGEVVGQAGGFLWVDTINDALTALGVGRVIRGYGNELLPAANGANMNISVPTGCAILQDGFVYLREAAGNVTIGAAHSTNPRIDRIILRLTREGQTAQGTVTLMVLAGTAAASPAAPNLTQSSTTWDLSLAQVLVDAGVTAIAADKVTDERPFTLTLPSSTPPASGDMLYIAGNRKLTNLPKGTDGQLLSLASGIPAWVSPAVAASLSVEVGNVLLDAGVDTLDFHAVDFALVESPENEVNIELQDHYKIYIGFDDTLRSTTNVSTFATQVTKSITLPTGTWDLECFAMARIATDNGLNVDARIRIDGTDSATSTRSGPSTGGAPIICYGSKSGVASGARTISFGFKRDTADVAYMSNALLVIFARRAS